MIHRSSTTTITTTTQSTKKPGKKKKKNPPTHTHNQPKNQRKKNQQLTDRSEIKASSWSKIDDSQHRHLLAMAAGLKLNQKWIKTHEILGDRPIGELRSCCRRRTRPATRLARPHSHRRWWRSAEARGRKIDEMRERESCAVRLREWEWEQRQEREKKEQK